MEGEDTALNPIQGFSNYNQLLLKRIQSLKENVKPSERPKIVAALLQDALTRLKLCMHDLAITSDSFSQFKETNEGMMKILSHRVCKIEKKVREVEKAENLTDDDTFRYSSSPLDSSITKEKNHGTLYCSSLLNQRHIQYHIKTD